MKPEMIFAGQSWGVVGRNGGGKTSLAASLTESGQFTRSALVSFEIEDALLEREIREVLAVRARYHYPMFPQVLTPAPT